MKNIKKILICCLCVVIMIAGTVLGTLAYLTDRDEAVNTFTVGDVDITVDEEDVNPDGTPTGEDRVQENEYHLLPGQTYLKDPTMTMEAGSEDAYVRMILTIHNHDAVQAIVDKWLEGDYAALLGGWNNDTWIYHGFSEDAAADTISFEFRYHETVLASDEDQVLPALFTTLIVPEFVNGAELATLSGNGEDGSAFFMTVAGHAIQATGFADEDAAWAGFELQLEMEARNS